MKFASFMPYDDGIGSGVRYLVPKNGYKKVGILHQDDDFGLDVLRGTQAALKELKMELAETTSYKRGATDFSSQIAKLKAADVELIVLGSTLRETIGAMGEAKKLGWNVAFLSSQAAYTALVPQLGKGVVEGLYAMSQVPHPYAEGANPQLAAWIESYKKRFNSDPDVMSSYGYKTMDMVLKGIEAAGKEPSPQSLSAALEGMKQPADFLGNGSVEFSKTNHLGRAQGRVAQIQNGKWVNLTDFLK
jgi:ABC-type branched-subunit amino acid transport system substrate-binding protein